MANDSTKTSEPKTSEPKDSKDSRTPIEQLREASTTEEETEVFEKAAKARVTTPDGQEGAPVPGDLGMRTEYWKAYGPGCVFGVRPFGAVRRLGTWRCPSGLDLGERLCYVRVVKVPNARRQEDGLASNRTNARSGRGP